MTLGRNALRTAEIAAPDAGSVFSGPPADRYALKAVDLQPDWDLCQTLGLNMHTRAWMGA
jgi:hypothetical protein